MFIGSVLLLMKRASTLPIFAISVGKMK